jgi:hypothetical protein
MIRRVVVDVAVMHSRFPFRSYVLVTKGSVPRHHSASLPLLSRFCKGCVGVCIKAGKSVSGLERLEQQYIVAARGVKD